MVAADPNRTRATTPRAAAADSSIFLEGVEKTYGGADGVHAIAPLSVELRAGEAVSVVGPSAAAARAPCCA